MSRSRMFGDDQPEKADNTSPRTTIVGGRPPQAKGAVPPVPTGIQRLLRMAALDPAFLAQLVERRGDIAQASGVELTPTEVSILRVIPAEQLIAMAERMPPPEAARREFLRQTAATAVVLLGGAALAACDACGGPTLIRGATADMPPAPLPPPPTPPPPGPPPVQLQPTEPPPPRPDVNWMQTEGGAAPDEPPPRPEAVEPRTAGVRPDIPPEPQPPPPYVSPPGGARPDMPPEPSSPRPGQSQPQRGIRSDVPKKK